MMSDWSSFTQLMSAYMCKVKKKGFIFPFFFLYGRKIKMLTIRSFMCFSIKTCFFKKRLNIHLNQPHNMQSEWEVPVMLNSVCVRK